MPEFNTNSSQNHANDSREATYWRIEGSLLNLSALRPVGFFNWNSQSFSDRWARRSGMLLMALLRPFSYGTSRTFATRFLHIMLRGISRDRLDLLGEEYFQYVLKPQLHREASEKLFDAVRDGQRIILVGQLLESLARPLARHFGIEYFLANRPEYRQGRATGRLLDPVVPPRGPLAWVTRGSANGRISKEKLLAQLGWEKEQHRLAIGLQPAQRPRPSVKLPVANFGESPRVNHLAVRQTLTNRHVMLIGV